MDRKGTLRTGCVTGRSRRVHSRPGPPSEAAGQRGRDRGLCLFWVGGVWGSAGSGVPRVLEQLTESVRVVMGARAGRSSPTPVAGHPGRPGLYRAALLVAVTGPGWHSASLSWTSGSAGWPTRRGRFDGARPSWRSARDADASVGRGRPRRRRASAPRSSVSPRPLSLDRPQPVGSDVP